MERCFIVHTLMERKVIGFMCFLVLSMYLLTVCREPTENSEGNSECLHVVLGTPELDFTVEQHIKVLEDDIGMTRNLNSACTPDSFGYNNEQAAALFPDKKYPTCEELYNNPANSLHYNRTTNTLTMNCKGKVLLGLIDSQELFGYQPFTNSPETYTEPLQLTTQEYAFGTCTERSNFFENAWYINRPKPESLSRAKSTLKRAPINIAIVVLDSVSRRSFYRKLPLSLNYLNTLNSTHRTFDFKIHNVMGEYSAESFMPMFFGDMKFSRQHGDLSGDFYYEQSMWKYLHENGFVTMLATDDCGNDFAAFIGEGPKVDHKIATFWCAAEKYYSFE